MATATVIAIGIVAVVIPIRTAATTNPILPTANSAAAVQEHCHRCRIRGPVGVVDNNAVAADTPEASPLPPSGAMDPTAAATTKTLNSKGNGGDGGDGDGNGNGGNGGNGNGNGNGDGNEGGGV